MAQNSEISLTQMRKSVQKLGSSTEKFEDPTLMRFLIARSMDPEKAAKMFVQWLKWRASMVPLGYISDNEVPDELAAKKIYLQGLSKDGYPVMLVKAHKHFPAKDQPQFKIESVIRSEEAQTTSNGVFVPLSKMVLAGCSSNSSFKEREIGNEKLVAILDLQQLAYKNIDPRGLITGFQFLQAYYPERLAKCFILNMPRFFVSVWKMVSRFLEKATLEKIVIVTSEDEKTDLIREIGEDALPEEYGGLAKLVALQEVKLTAIATES